MISKRNIFQLAVIFAIAFALKYHYSTASVDGLRWILTPTTFLVETITGTQFRFESQAGYLSDDRTFLIAVPCSGVNFLIIAFVMLTVGKIWRDRDLSWGYMPIALLASYISTLIANTTRIVIALQLRKYDLGYDYEEVHRIEGIVVYFLFLLLLFFVSERIGKQRVDVRDRRRFTTRRLIIPLTIYFAVTLGIPILRGSFYERDFWGHGLAVAITPVILLLPFVVLDLVRKVSSTSNTL